MVIKLIAVGTKMPAWVTSAFEEYQKRLPKQCELKLVEINAKHRGKNADIDRILRDEAEAIKKALDQQDLLILLDRKGKAVSTEDLAKQLQNWIDNNQNVAIVIGGPEGIDPNLLKVSQRTWSVSAMTFAHPLVRVILAEQIYRAWSINAGLPYHRGD